MEYFNKIYLINEKAAIYEDNISTVLNYDVGTNVKEFMVLWNSHKDI